MREWTLKAEDLPRLSLAADARLCAPNYVNDQVWELSLAGGEPPVLALQTTYGLRARSMRMFPRFVEGNLAISDPATFPSPPVVRRFYPNYLLVTFAPLPEIEVSAEYWAASSEAVCGRLQVTNLGAAPRLVRAEWSAVLTPTEDGRVMAAEEIEGVTVLAGYSGGLAPLIFLTGGAIVAPSPFPALAQELELPPGATRQLSWRQAALPTPQASFETVRRLAGTSLDAEAARLEMVNAAQVEIHTGDPDWDLAFSLVQKIALGLFLGPTAHLPHASFVNARGPDHGYSLRGDGSDYGHLWNGQTCLDAYNLADLILPGAPDLAWGMLHNFLSTQDPDGQVDWKPGLGGQRGNQLATPLLASLAWRIYQRDGNRAELEKIFPSLLNFLHAWFTAEHDRDGDGLPEWDHPLQAGFEDHPLFSRWHPWAKSVDITTAESPALCALLYRECRALLQMAELLGRPEPTPALQSLAETLRTAIENSWEARSASYHYWDRDVHACPDERTLGRRRGSGVIQVNLEFEQPVRLVMRVRSAGESTRRSQVFIHGAGAGGHHRIERVSADTFQWFLGMGSFTSERAYAAVDYLEVQGLDHADVVSLHVASLSAQDYTLLLPLWAGIPSEERAHTLVTQTITNPRRYWRTYGLPACPGTPSDKTAASCQSIDFNWVSLVGEGLLAYGFRTQAAELLSRLMKAAVQTLKSEGCFRRYYHAETGFGQGERDALGGLPPLGLFLEILGVQLLTPFRVALAGTNPFPWPVTVKYRGLTVLRQKETTLVMFPDGQSVSFDDPAPGVVALE
ncbi:MAG TPA: hypothetical protein VJ436_00665 [Anaerolineales bacterium]|nr:hypothetical protein [Anaerolineales bacterium]